MTGALLATTATLAWLVGYVIACWVWPFADCAKCKGSGRKRSPSGKAFRLCRRCKGSGKRIRTGRRIFNWLQVLRKEGS
jgi:hypothetical protein